MISAIDRSICSPRPRSSKEQELPAILEGADSRDGQGADLWLGFQWMCSGLGTGVALCIWKQGIL